MTEPTERRDRVGSVGRVLTLLVTNAIKITGVWIGLKAATAARPDAVVLAYSAFMMAGAQLSENVVLGVVDRVLGKPVSREEEAKERRP